MNKISHAGGIFLLLFNFSLKAQPFYPLGNGFNTPWVQVRYAFADSALNLIFFGGDGFFHSDATKTNLAKWDGLTLDSASHMFYGNINSIEKYNNEIYAAGNILLDTQPVVYPNLVKLSGFNLIPFAQPVPDIDAVKSLQGDLYLMGRFPDIAGFPYQNIVKYDGVNFYGFPSIFPSQIPTDILINTAIFFNNELYVGGNFDSLPPYKSDIVKFDTSINNWVDVGGGLSGYMSFVTDMVIYKGEFYIAGNICTCYGDAGNGVIKWNGTSFSPVGTGVIPNDATVWKLHVFDEKLWAVGEFSGMGGQPASHVAYWDSVQWHNIPNATFDNTINAITSLNNDLYLGGGFWTLNGDSVHHVVRYNTTTGIESINQNEPDIKIYPNPAKNFFQITYDLKQNQNAEFNLFNSFGQKIKKIELSPNTHSAAINVTALPNGIYFWQTKSYLTHSLNGKLIILK